MINISVVIHLEVYLGRFAYRTTTVDKKTVELTNFGNVKMSWHPLPLGFCKVQFI